MTLPKFIITRAGVLRAVNGQRDILIGPVGGISGNAGGGRRSRVVRVVHDCIGPIAGSRIVSGGKGTPVVCVVRFFVGDKAEP